MFVTIIFLSFMGFCVAGLLSEQIGPKRAAALSTFCSLTSFSFSSLYFYKIVSTGSVFHRDLVVGVHFYSDFVLIHWEFDLNIFNSSTVATCVVITFVSTLVHLCSIKCMYHDQDLLKFMSYLSLITFFMLILVTSDGFIPIFLGLVGLLLSFRAMTNFWITRAEANKTETTETTIYKISKFCFIMSLLIFFLKLFY
jgi:NADH:ubiquinone oxidoreductase subunit 5 (subunit L)/multisubunit Na+/H+ antiporter MnhA subunit